MRLWIPILSTFMIFLAPGSGFALQGQPACLGCADLAPNAMEEAARLTRNTLLKNKGGALVSQRLDYWGIGKVCSKFATPNDFGPWSKLVKKYMTPETHPALYEGTEDILNSCKSFPLFDNEQKEEFYAYLFAHLAYAESSCDTTVHAPGPNGRAHGLLALHKNKEPLYTQNDYSRNKCNKGDSLTAEGSLRCGLAMLDGQFASKGELFSRKGYWGPLTPQTRKKVTVHFYNSQKPDQRREKSQTMNANKFIRAAVKMFPLCR